MRSLLDVEIPAAGKLTLIELLRRLKVEFEEDHLRAYAGNLAFRGIFAIFAMLTLTLSILDVFDAQELLADLLDQVSSVIPPPVLATLQEDVLEASRESTDAGGVLRTSVTLSLSLYALAAAARGVIDALNAMYGVEEKRPTFKRIVFSILMSFVVIALLLTAAIVVVIGPDVTRSLGDVIGAGETARTLWLILRWPAMLTLVLLAYALVYFYAPAQRVPFRLISHGSLVAFPGWLLFTFAFSVYVTNYANLGRYGGLAGLIALVLYLFFSSMIMLVGAEVNDIIERHRRAQKAAQTRMT